MKGLSKIQIALLSVALSFAVVCVALIGYQNAFATNLDDWRPSCIVVQNIESLKNKINEDEASIKFLEDLISDYENNGNEFTENIEVFEARYNYLHDYINDQQLNIEGLTKLSFASYFAKTMLDDVVGNDFATDNIFKWGIVNFILSFEDDTILNLLNDYFDAKDNLEEAISEEQRAEDMYNNAKIDIEKVKSEIPALRDNISYWESRLPLIYEVEEVYGAAGPSKIQGDNYFCWPLEQLNVASPFGEERGTDEFPNPNVYGSSYYHKGTDFSADEGTPVYAAADGYIIEAGANDTMGNYIKIQHADGFETIYMHLSHIYVPLGVKVHRGDNIALSGNTGDSTGPHLHFQVQLNGSPVDPMNYL